MSRYKIGDTVWHAHAGTKDKWITCPDCFGKRFLTVTLGDDSQVTIDCTACFSGCDTPRGMVKTYSYEANVRSVVITGMESHMKEGKEQTRYYFDRCCLADEDQFSDTKEGAEDRAVELATDHAREEEARLAMKHKDTRSWAWNATYHRGCVKRAERELEYHRVKLSAALKHKKKEIA